MANENINPFLLLYIGLDFLYISFINVCWRYYLKHRKLFHIDIVPECTNKIDGACRYGDTNCWFKHNIEKYYTKGQKEC